MKRLEKYLQPLVITALFCALGATACDAPNDGSGDGGTVMGNSLTLDGTKLAIYSSIFHRQTDGSLVAAISDGNEVCATTNDCASTHPEGTYVEVTYAGIAVGEYVVGATANVRVFRVVDGEAAGTSLAVNGFVALDTYATDAIESHFDVGLQDGGRVIGKITASSCPTFAAPLEDECEQPTDLGVGAHD